MAEMMVVTILDTENTGASLCFLGLLALGQPAALS